MTPQQVQDRFLAEALKPGRGTPATIIWPNGTPTFGGGVTEAPESQAVTLFGPLEDNEQVGSMQGATATFYIPAKGLLKQPRMGDRINVGSKTFAVATVTKHAIAGTVVAWQVTAGETAPMAAP